MSNAYILSAIFRWKFFFDSNTVNFNCVYSIFRSYVSCSVPKISSLFVQHADVPNDTLRSPLPLVELVEAVSAEVPYMQSSSDSSPVRLTQRINWGTVTLSARQK
jgi:hypothetical protein